MPEQPKRPPPLPRDVRGAIGPDQPERGAVASHPGVEGAEQRVQPARRVQTLKDFPSPSVPGDLTPTVKAPRDRWSKQTIRMPTPPSSVALARRSDPPASDEPPASEKPASAPVDVSAANVAAIMAKLTEYERRERVRLESLGPGPYQRPIESAAPVPPSPAPVSSRPPSSGDWAKLRFKVATAVVAALVVVIAALAYWGAAAINAKTEAIRAAQDAKAKADSRDGQWRQWASVATWIQDCRNGQQLDVNEMLLPAPDKMSSARKLEPWIVKCPKLLPPPP